MSGMWELFAGEAVTRGRRHTLSIHLIASGELGERVSWRAFLGSFPRSQAKRARTLECSVRREGSAGALASLHTGQIDCTTDQLPGQCENAQNTKSPVGYSKLSLL